MQWNLYTRNGYHYLIIPGTREREKQREREIERERNRGARIQKATVYCSIQLKAI